MSQITEREDRLKELEGIFSQMDLALPRKALETDIVKRAREIYGCSASAARDYADVVYTRIAMKRAGGGGRPSP